MNQKSNKYIELRTVWLSSMEQKEALIPEEAIILREQPIEGEYDQWQVDYYLPESINES